MWDGTHHLEGAMYDLLHREGRDRGKEVHQGRSSLGVELLLRERAGLVRTLRLSAPRDGGFGADPTGVGDV